MRIFRNARFETGDLFVRYVRYVRYVWYVHVRTVVLKCAYGTVRTYGTYRTVLWYGTCGTVRYGTIHADRFEICGSFSSQLSLFRIWHYTHGTCGKYYTYSIVRMIRTVQTGHGCFEARLWYSTYGTVRMVHMVRYRTVHVVQYGTLHMVRYVWYVRYGTCGSS